MRRSSRRSDGERTPARAAVAFDLDLQNHFGIVLGATWWRGRSHIRLTFLECARSWTRTRAVRPMSGTARSTSRPRRPRASRSCSRSTARRTWAGGTVYRHPLRYRSRRAPKNCWRASWGSWLPPKGSSRRDRRSIPAARGPECKASYGQTSAPSCTHEPLVIPFGASGGVGSLIARPLEAPAGARAYVSACLTAQPFCQARMFLTQIRRTRPAEWTSRAVFFAHRPRPGTRTKSEESRHTALLALLIPWAIRAVRLHWNPSGVTLYCPGRVRYPPMHRQKVPPHH